MVFLPLQVLMSANTARAMIQEEANAKMQFTTHSTILQCVLLQQVSSGATLKEATAAALEPAAARSGDGVCGSQWECCGVETRARTLCMHQVEAAAMAS